MDTIGIVRIGYIQDGHDRLGHSEDTVRKQDKLRVHLGYSEDSQDTVRIQMSRLKQTFWRSLCKPTIQD